MAVLNQGFGSIGVFIRARSPLKQWRLKEPSQNGALPISKVSPCVIQEYRQAPADWQLARALGDRSALLRLHVAAVFSGLVALGSLVCQQLVYQLTVSAIAQLLVLGDTCPRPASARIPPTPRSARPDKEKTTRSINIGGARPRSHSETGSHLDS